jgi:hypothetical protein
MSPVYDNDADALEHADKPRPKGSLPYLPDGDNVRLGAWLTRAFRPPPGFVAEAFERGGKQRTDPCSLTFRNGRETRTFRFTAQSDLVGRRLRATALGISDGWLRMGRLKDDEIEDVWAALCIFGRVLSDFDDREETHKWTQQLVSAAEPFVGYSLVPDARHDALMALKRHGEFKRHDALAFPGGERRPVRFVDAHTGEQFVRSGETAAFVRWVLGVEPLSYSTLRARLADVKIVGRFFEDRRPPHPKLMLYRLTERLVEEAEGYK